VEFVRVSLVQSCMHSLNGALRETGSMLQLLLCACVCFCLSVQNSLVAVLVALFAIAHFGQPTRDVG